MEYDPANNEVRFSEAEMHEFVVPAQLTPGTADFEQHEDRIRAASIQTVIEARLAVEDDDTVSIENISALQQRAQRAVNLCLALTEARRKHEITSLERKFEL
jgi:hypothetical protein